jgi:hypothetical protein
LMRGSQTEASAGFMVLWGSPAEQRSAAIDPVVD